MIDRLIDFLVGTLELFQFWVVVYEYERAVLLRLGRFVRVLEPGLHWCYPFHIDVAQHDNVVTRTHILNPQALTTRDGRTVSVTAVVTSNIRDIRKALLNVEGVSHALNDSCSAAVGAHVARCDWAELRTEPAAEDLTKECRKQAWRYGIEIERVQLTDLALCRVIRLHTASADHLPINH